MTASAPDKENLIDSEYLEFISAGEAEAWEPSKILTWVVGNFHPRLALSCSFGNPEGLVLLDMMHRIEPAARVFVLDTGRLPQETYDLIDRVRDAYVTGLRRDQGVTRSEVRKVDIDPGHGIVKVNPLADWSVDDVWKYVRANRVPTNRLHQAGYPTVGCAPCTRAVRPGEDPRAGRWWSRGRP